MVITIKGVVGGQTASPPPTVSVLLPSPDFTPPTPTQTGSETPGPGLWCLCVPVPTRPPRGRCWYDGVFDTLTALGQRAGGAWPWPRGGVPLMWNENTWILLPVLAVSLCSL